LDSRTQFGRRHDQGSERSGSIKLGQVIHFGGGAVVIPQSAKVLDRATLKEHCSSLSEMTEFGDRRFPAGSLNAYFNWEFSAERGRMSLAFCDEFETILIPDSSHLRRIGEFALDRWPLKSIWIPNAVLEISGSAFVSWLAQIIRLSLLNHD